MDLSGSQRIEAPRDMVWRALNDPTVLKRCIPGCQDVTAATPTEFTAKVVLKIGPMKATFTSAVTLSDLDPPRSYRINGEGQGGIAGFAKGGADIRLTQEDGATVLTYDAQANVGGKIAQLGARLIESSCKKLIAEFFTTLSEILAMRVAKKAARENAE